MSVSIKEILYFCVLLLGMYFWGFTRGEASKEAEYFLSPKIMAAAQERQIQMFKDYAREICEEMQWVGGEGWASRRR